MLRGRIPRTIFPSKKSVLTEEIGQHRFYKHYKLRPYMFIESYGDMNYMFEYYGLYIPDRNYRFHGYKSYTDVKFRKYFGKSSNVGPHIRDKISRDLLTTRAGRLKGTKWVFAF